MIAFIDGCGSNLASLTYAFKRLGVKSIITDKPEVINQAKYVVLPGVGQASHAMAQLEKKDLINTIKNLTQPVLGICLGMQLLYQSSDEGDCKCLDILPGKITKFPKNKELIIPHMGWNQLEFYQNDANSSPLLKDIFFNNNNAYVYYVHSYYAAISEHTLATSTHGIQFSAMVKFNNFYGMQFHPEKSSAIGEQLLNIFLKESAL